MGQAAGVLALGGAVGVLDRQPVAQEEVDLVGGSAEECHAVILPRGCDGYGRVGTGGHTEPVMSTDHAATWPFWAPSDLAAVEAALDLAGVAAGEVVVDLGCGDGQVLVAAARRGARAIGVESDTELVRLARRALEGEGLEGEVIEGDLFDLDLGELGADVVFTYLAPATLQRLGALLRPLRGLRLVTVDFEVPGVVVDERAGQAHLYRLPGRRSRRPSRPGWTSDGALVVAPPGYQSLTVLEAHHPGGEVEVRLSDELAGAAALFTGADHCEPRDALAVDLRWDDHPAGTLLTGHVLVEGLDPFPLTAIFDGDFEEGCWELSDEGVDNVVRHLEATGGVTDAHDLVRAAEG